MMLHREVTMRRSSQRAKCAQHIVVWQMREPQNYRCRIWVHDMQFSGMDGCMQPELVCAKMFSEKKQERETQRRQLVERASEWL